jgi:uncharacterized protein YggE
MKYLFAALLLAALLAGPAGAETVLQLSATGIATAVPDETTASLTVQATAPTAGAAQAQVNQAMGKALAAARAVDGVVATTAGYSVQDSSQKQDGSQFQASQSLTLTIPAPGGAPPAAFTALVGGLQAKNLLLNNLDGDLSVAGRAAAQAQAITDAINRIKQQAAQVAGTLGEKVGTIKTINLQTDSGPMPRMGAMMAMAAPAPQAAPGPVTVTANINAEIALVP